MSNKERFNIHSLFNIILSVLVFVAGICLMAGCLYIYYVKGEYSAEIVGEVFGYIAVPLYVCLALILGGFVYEFISPLKKKKEKPERDHYHQLLKLRAKKDLIDCDKTVRAAIRKENIKRRIFVILRAVIVAFCASVFLVFALVPSNYHQSDINESMIFMMTVLAPCLFVSGAFCVFVAVFSKRSMIREIELLKKIPDKKFDDGVVETNCDTKLVVKIIGYTFVGALIAALLITGISLGGFADVMTKAVNICTECIGLG